MLGILVHNMFFVGWVWCKFQYSPPIFIACPFWVEFELSTNTHLYVLGVYVDHMCFVSQDPKAHLYVLGVYIQKSEFLPTTDLYTHPTELPLTIHYTLSDLIEHGGQQTGHWLKLHLI